MRAQLPLLISYHYFKYIDLSHLSGENVVVYLEIDNHSSNTMRPMIELHQRVDFKTRGSKRNSTKLTAGTSTQEKIKANTRHNTHVLTLPMNMARTVPTLQTSNISISHWVKVSIMSLRCLATAVFSRMFYHHHSALCIQINY